MTKMRLVDFNKIQENISFAKILEYYEIELREEGKSLVGQCPLCTDDQSTETRRFRVTPEINAWKCFQCKQGGNKLALVAALEFTDKKGAAIILANAIAKQFDIDISGCYLNAGRRKKLSKSDKEAPATDLPVDTHDLPGEDSSGDGEGKAPEESVAVGSNKIRGNPPLEWETGLKGLDPEHQALLQAGFTPEVIKSFGAGMCSKGMMKGRLAVPIYNDDLQLLGYCGIALDGREDRLKWPKPEHFEKGLELFNLYQATNSKHFSEYGLILVEDRACK